MKSRIFIVLVLLYLIPTWGANNFKEMDVRPQTGITVLSSPRALETEIDPDAYIVGVGDIFIVEKIQNNITYSLPVLPTGVISIPGVATIKISGKTLSEALGVISKETGPYSYVTLHDVKELRIPVSGAVENPGIKGISAASRLSDLLRNTTLNPLAKDFAIEIRSKEKTRIINIYEFYLNGDLDNNPYLHAGESIYIPYADIETECVEISGPVVLKKTYEYSPDKEIPASFSVDLNENGICPYIPGETLQNLLDRKILLGDNVNYENILLTREKKDVYVPISDLDNIIIQSGDKIEFISALNIIVSGNVNRPESFGYIPGLTVIDYISMAGGVTSKGNEKRTVLIRDGKKIGHSLTTNIKRGDIIIVKRSIDNIFMGEESVLSFIGILASIAATVLTAFIAAGN